MIKIEFDFLQEITLIQAELVDTFQKPINIFLSKHSELDPKKVFFTANDKPIYPKSSIESQMSTLDKQNKLIRILVKNDIIIDIKEVICPQCKESCRLKFDKGKINLYDCKNNHSINTINIFEFPITQKIDNSKIICDNCKKSYKHGFYKCLTWGNNICSLCQEGNDTNHSLVKYEEKNCICPKHNDGFIQYCSRCNTNLCVACFEEHQGHEIMHFGNLIPKSGEIKKKVEEMTKEFETFDNNINSLIYKLNEMKNIINLFKDININILKNFDMRNKNYNILQNLKEIINNNDIYIKIKEINIKK